MSSRALNGSSRSSTPKSHASIKPSQKIGMLTPVSAPTTLAWSNADPRRHAEMMPAGKPTTSANNSATTLSSAVAGSRCMSSVVTGTLLRMDRPRSPCRICPTNRTYCVGHG